MREIKFRIWYCNKMCYPYLQETFIGRANVIHMQYTGLKDKNGKEIYEGDILRADKANPFWYGDNRYMGIGGSYVMEFWEGSFTFMRGQCITQDTISFMGLEVIGNIYENPELMEKK